MPGWKERLQPASFRGVAFSVDSDEGSFGRRVQVHEYPLRDKPWTEDLGRATRRFTLTAYLVGQDFMTQRDRLIAAIEKPGAATLVHPFYGEMTVNVEGAVRISHSNREGRSCKVSFAVVECGELTFPVAGIATASLLAEACAELDAQIAAAFSAFDLEGLADFVQSGVINDAAAMLDKVSDAFDMVDTGIASASLLLKGELWLVLTPPANVLDFIDSVQRLWRSGKRLENSAQALVSRVRALAKISIDYEFSPRGVWLADSRTTQQKNQQRNLLAAALRVSALSEAALSITQLPQPRRTSPSGLNAASVPDRARSHPVLNAAEKRAPQDSLYWDDLVALREQVNAAIDNERLRTTDDVLFLALTQLQSRVNQDIATRLTQVERTVMRSAPDVLPAVVLAAKWFDDAARENDITGRNNIAHPGFVAVAPLRVPLQ
ncbi:DNA circularization protein [Enterobacterales bacterium CwR94]|nr:DNA circularization protein [Enterobacterales bacterium CwR94]